MNDDTPAMRRTMTADRNRCFAALTPDGTLKLTAGGHGLALTLSAPELREFARVALGVADELEQRSEAAAQAALQALARIVT